MRHAHYVYILASRTRHLYVGVTNDLLRRLAQHRSRPPTRYTGRYAITRLVHAEVYGYVWDALRREKQIKGWTRAKKIALVESGNPSWEDLTAHARAERLLR